MPGYAEFDSMCWINGQLIYHRRWTSEDERMSADPNDPGGWAAKKNGCTCEATANRWGEGIPRELLPPDAPNEPHFLIASDCPIHAVRPAGTES